MKHMRLAGLALLWSAYPLDALGFESIPVYKGAYVADVATTKAHEVFYHFHGVVVNLTISYEDRQADAMRQAYPIESIKDNLVFSHTLFLELLSEQGIEAVVCKRPYHAHVFILSPNTMYESGMFDSLMEERGISAVYALMDKTYEINGHNNFLFSDRGGWENYQALQHEFAHYWHDRYCLWDRYPDSEVFADMMENRAEARVRDSLIPGRAQRPSIQSTTVEGSVQPSLQLWLVQ